MTTTTPAPSLASLASLASLIALGVLSCTIAGCDPADGGVGSISDDYDDATVEGCRQVEDFLDVSDGFAGEDYSAPLLEVACTEDEVIVRSNGIIDHEFVAITPNPLTWAEHTWLFPRDPAPASVEADVPLGGVVAVAVNGMPVFGPTEAPEHGYAVPLLDSILDYCNGHTAPGGVYHYHARPECLFTDLEGNTSLVIAYALDGYPILAPYACGDAECTSVKELQSSWQPVDGQFDADGEPLYDGVSEGSWDIHAYVEGSGDLDRCNGRELAGGDYAYYATDTFPYFVGCYHGTPTANSLGGGGSGGDGMMPPPGEMP